MRNGMYTYLICCMVMAMVLWSCGREDAPVPDDAVADDVCLSLTVEGYDGDPVSRAPAGDGYYDRGTLEECYIGFGQGDFMLCLLDEVSNTVIAHVDDMFSVPVPIDPANKKYKLLFTVDGGLYNRLQGHSVKVLLLANWKIYPDVFTGMSLDGLVMDEDAVMPFTPFGDRLDKDTRRIPMYGICRSDNLQLSVDPDSPVDLGTIHMLRSYAKTEVVDGGDLKDEKNRISTVELVRYSDSVAKAPYGVYDEQDYVKGDWQDDYGDAPSIPASAGVVDDTALFGGEAGGKSFVIYCPEFCNVRDGVALGLDSRSRILITYADGLRYYVDYKDYKTDTAFDIRRNYHYRFTVTRTEYDIRLVVDVSPYMQVDLDPSFGLPDLDTESSALLEDFDNQ